VQLAGLPLLAKFLPTCNTHGVLRNVAAAVGDGVAVFELGVVCEVFGLDRTADGLPKFDFAVCAVDPPPLKTSAGFLIDTPHRIGRLAKADLIVVPAWNPVDRPVPETLRRALRSAVSRGARVMSVCSGAFALAAAGLLDGRRATTHWRHARKLAELYPEVRVDPDVLYVDDDPILTSAGTSAGIDLCLHLVRKEFGAEVANTIARRMVVPPHRDGGQAQFIERPVPVEHEEIRLSTILEWGQRHLADNLSVEQLARRARMAPRSFARHFRASVGTTPYRWLLDQRIGSAQDLLERSRLSIEEIAGRCGFETAAAFRIQFARRVGVPPSRYREQFERGQPTKATSSSPVQPQG
jgi:transcriptional regulator GlxA family with amidase domain